jgi:sugar lactone lactonase YvrE
MSRRMVTGLVALAGFAALGGTTAVAQAPTRIPLPDGWQPEGIASSNNRLFVGSIPTGAVYRINPSTGNGRVFVSGREGRAAIGLKVAGGRLWVAGGGTGRAFIYNATTGRPVRDFRVAPAGDDTFVNDVAVTSTAAYFTDSRRSALYVVPRDLSAPRTLPLPDIPTTAGNNLNGIVATPDGRTLIVVQTNVGRLWRVDATTGRAAQINLGGASVANGDGLLLVGRTLYVVRNRVNRIAVISLQPDLGTGRLVRSIVSRQFDVPTTIARIGDRLYAANARFGTTANANTRYWVTRVSR